MSSPTQDPSPNRRQETGERSRIWGLGLGLLMLGTAGAFVLGREATQALLLPASLAREGAREVPDLVGRDLEDARRRALEAGSALDVLGVAYGGEVDSGEVLVQFPPEGMPLESGQPIEVLVGAGPGVRRVPDVRGLPEAEARTLLEEAGTPAGASRRVDESAFSDGAVAGTEPAMGSPVGDADSVTLLVSHTGAVVEVPDVRGRSLEEARQALGDAQLEPGAASRDDGAAPSDGDVVLAQDPPAGGLARTGAGVDLRMGPPRDEAE